MIRQIRLNEKTAPNASVTGIEHQAEQRHQRGEAQVGADRRGHGAGAAGIAEVHDLVRDPPQIPM